MKGFVRILEAVVASIIILSAISYFFVPVSRETGWDDALLRLVMEDSLASMGKNSELNGFILANDAASLDAALKRLMPDNAEFSVTIRGIPKPEIKIGCVDCDVDEVQSLKKLLGPLEFEYKQRTIKIFEPKIMSFPGIDDDTDILFFFGYDSLRANKDAVLKFMESGGRVFLLDNLEESDLSDGLLASTFGLSWCPLPPDPESCPGNPAMGEFYEHTNPSNPSFRTANYYATVSGVSVFSGFGNENSFMFNNDNIINKIRVDGNTIISTNSRKASFLKVSERVGARTAWMAGFDFEGGEENMENIRNLTKSAVMWLTSNSYTIDPPYKRVPAGPLNVYEYFAVLPGFEPFSLSLVAWRIF